MLERWLADPATVSASALMLAAIVAFALGKVITLGHHLQVVSILQARIEELTKDRDDYRKMLLDATGTNDRALAVAQRDVRRKEH